MPAVVHSIRASWRPSDRSTAPSTTPTLTFVPKPVEGISLTPDLTVEEAIARHLRAKTFNPGEEFGGIQRRRKVGARFVCDRTMRTYRQFQKPLTLFFGRMRLDQITAGYLLAYQEIRAAGKEPFMKMVRGVDKPIPSPCGALQINKELLFFKTILRRAGLWKSPLCDDHQDLYSPPSEIQRAMTQEQEREWLAAAGSNVKYSLVYWFSILSLHTCMGPNEMYKLRLQDINLESRIATVPREGAKNKYRHRTIPLDDQALEAVKWLLKRAESCGCTEPTHYLFPLRMGKGAHVPEAPMTDSGIKKPWYEVSQMTGLTWLRRYDLRHTAITRLAEGGMSLPMIMSMAGHNTLQMNQHYTHISAQAQLKAMQGARVLAVQNQPTPAATVQYTDTGERVAHAEPLPAYEPQPIDTRPIDPLQPRWKTSPTFLMGFPLNGR
jgi:integrase